MDDYTDYTDYDSMVNEQVAELQNEYDEGHYDHLERDWDEDYEGDAVDEDGDEDYDGQPDEYTEWQDYMGGDDWDNGQYDE